MSRRRHLLDPLPKHAAPSHDIRNFVLITIDLNRARPHKIRRRLQIKKLCFHVFSLI